MDDGRFANETKTEHVTSSESVDGAKIMPDLGVMRIDSGMLDRNARNVTD